MANKKEFKPHMMYIKDKQKADTYEEHLDLQKKGYDHTPFNVIFRRKRRKNPCWKGYEMIGMKTKRGRQVPNCVRKKNK